MEVHYHTNDVGYFVRFLQALVGFVLIGVSTFLAWVFPIIYLLTVHYVIISYDGEVPPKDISTILLVLQQFLGVFMSINSAVNPIIYSFTQKPFKENFAKVFHRVVNQCGCSKLPAHTRKNTITTQVVSALSIKAISFPLSLPQK